MNACLQPALFDAAFRQHAGSAAFSPLDVPGLAGWWDADHAAGLFQLSDGTTAATADGDPVGYWADRSGNGRHLTQATSAKRATLKTAVQNGRSALRFDGADDWLRAEFADVAQPFTAFAAVLLRSDGGYRYVWDGVGANLGLCYATPGTALAIYAGTELPYSLSYPTAFLVLSCLFDGASSVIRTQGVQRAAGAAGAAALTGGLTLAATSSLNGYFGNHDYGEVLLYEGDRAADFAAIEGYLNAKWGAY